MDEGVLVAVGVVVVIALLVIAGMFLLRKRKTGELRDRFGPEYEHAVKEAGDRSRAEAALKEREKRVESLNIRPLAPEDATRFKGAWTKIQTRFVDDPKGAVKEADRLLGEVMARRGYPVGDFEQRAADVSVDHPRVVEHYRAGHDIALRHEKGQAGTEDLRQAMIHYRTLFTELVGETDAPPIGVLRK